MEVEMKEQEVYHPLPKRESEPEYKPGYFEIQDILRNAAIDKYKRYCEGRPYFDFGNPTYDYLKEKGVIHIGIDTATKIYEEAKKQVAIEKGITPSVMSKRQLIERELGIEVTAKSVAKRMALEMFFAECQKQGVKMEELI